MARKREVVTPHAGDRRFVRRDAQGRFKDVVDAGKSVARDRLTDAKRVVKPGQGDKGDIRR